MGVRVGSLAGTRKGVFLQHRDGVLVYGPTGAGKTWFLAWHLVMDAPAACLVTTTKADLLASTWLHRSRIGPVGVFDPEGLTGWPNGVRWSPLSGVRIRMLRSAVRMRWRRLCRWRARRTGTSSSVRRRYPVAVLSACGCPRWLQFAGCSDVGDVENDTDCAEHSRGRGRSVGAGLGFGVGADSRVDRGLVA